jgi:CubicO group peptidase (beta-lactamase class C family)
MKQILFLFIIISLIACKKDNVTVDETLFFPPLNSESWEMTDPEDLGWNINNLSSLYDYLSQQNTRAFIVLKNGKIVLEKYWGNNINNTASFDKNTVWYWASAGKSLTACLTGIAQSKGYLNINNKSSDYLGQHWTNLPLEKEDLILVKHQLTMTSGLDYNVTDLDNTEPSSLNYQADAGNQWYYHNAAYTLIENVVSNASGLSYNQFSDENIENKIGMTGSWIQSGYNNIYWSTARDAARFGLLILNKGKWQEEPIIEDSEYFNAMTNTSQNLNPSYGYLWWLNGKPSIIYPGNPNSFSFSLAPDAPADMFAAMGKNGQFIDIIPSQNLVIVRMGEAPDNSLVPILFHNEMWVRINQVIN